LVVQKIEEDGVIGFQFKNEKSERCLKIPTPINQNGTDLVQSNCASAVNGNRNQIWFERPQGDGLISLMAFHNSKCLDLEGGNLPNGSRFQQWDCVKDDNQLFSVTEAPVLTDINVANIVGEGSIIRIGLVNGNCIDSRQALNDGGAIKSWDCNLNSNSQKFKVIKKVDGKWLQFDSIQSPGLCLTLPTPINENSTNLKKANCKSAAGNARKAQMWAIVDLPGDWFMLKNRRSGKCMDLEGGYTANNTPIQQWDCKSDEQNQWFKLVN
jgi:hypothetical protein